MKFAVPAVVLATFVLASCNTPPVQTAEQMVAAYLSKNGLHVVDTSQIMNYEPGSGGQSAAATAPSTLCFSAPSGVAYRAYNSSGQTVQGVACVEKDNSITVVLQRVVQ